MPIEVLQPRLDVLLQEYVLVQAWKKTAVHIRNHNWYSDTLELQRTAVLLPRFLGDLSERLAQPTDWRSTPLRVVLAPKSQTWNLSSDATRWKPASGSTRYSKLRPLAHVSIGDQVAATAIMLCLADRLESLQGDPESPIGEPSERPKVVSYGNRLVCDLVHGQLRHRWASTKLYRSFFDDYRAFLRRPGAVADTSGIGSENMAVVHLDLQQFYDRVTPELLAARLDLLSTAEDDRRFFELAKRVLNWAWSPKDARELRAYASSAGIDDYSVVSLPQGLVAAGFFANLVLGGVDDVLRASVDTTIGSDIILLDACRYVDDLRFVVHTPSGVGLDDAAREVSNWLAAQLDRHAAGLQLAPDKTTVARIDGDDRPLLRQSAKMERIQAAVSGGFDAVGGDEILTAVQSLLTSQQRHAASMLQEDSWPLSPVPDVADATVARFAAARFRRTCRSLRPLLSAETRRPGGPAGPHGEAPLFRSPHPRSQAELDADTRVFALGLVERWLRDPSNVRLLRIGLDLWPDANLLTTILTLLRPYTVRGRMQKAPRRVAWYCTAELFRAAATETGRAGDAEALPAELDINDYQSVLIEEATRLLGLPAASVPWYLRQQILLFLATVSPNAVPAAHRGGAVETRRYGELIRFLQQDVAGLSNDAYAVCAIVVRRSIVDDDAPFPLMSRGLTPARFERIGASDLSFARELLNLHPHLAASLSRSLRADLLIGAEPAEPGWVLLSDTVVGDDARHSLRNELALLRFADLFLAAVNRARGQHPVLPTDVELRFKHEGGVTTLAEVRIRDGRYSPASSLYSYPHWCEPTDRWRFRLGYLMRFVLAAREDFTASRRTRALTLTAPGFRISAGHWYSRIYGLFNGRAAFDEDWLPISDWTERLLAALLRWPGHRLPDASTAVDSGAEATRLLIRQRVALLEGMRSTMGGVLLLPFDAPRLTDERGVRQLRACVVQTILPTEQEIKEDLTCSDKETRRRHRNHLSAALAAVERMLVLRDTHLDSSPSRGRLDWLVLPELSVHPDDVRTHLIPFARQHRAMVLAGLTYEKVAGRPLLANTAVWVIPVESKEHGLNVITLRQGKQHLAGAEQLLNAPVPRIGGFRPCQWLIGYGSSPSTNDRSLQLTASVCYDATDLSLAAGLRHYSDVYAITALNQDVTTFDQMALALHYHMFQMVVVANNGKYGGSNAYAPYNSPFKRQVFHLHGQPQASIAFLEIDDIADFLGRKGSVNKAPDSTKQGWKSPPAGL